MHMREDKEKGMLLDESKIINNFTYSDVIFICSRTYCISHGALVKYVIVYNDSI